MKEVKMPELPEVETVMQAVAKAVGYSNIIGVTVNNNRFREKIPDDLAAKVSGAKITNYKRIAKYITIGLDNSLTIIWHLGMSGKVKICDKLPCPLDKHDHVIVQTDKCFLIFNDTRRFGLLTYCESDKLGKNPFLARAGTDPFDSGLTSEYLYSRLHKKKIPIKAALLDQSIICGIGNIYASEILYMARISPQRPTDKISPVECGILIKKTREVLKKAIAAGGSTIHDYKKPDGSLGYFQNMHCVYNKTGQQCPDCTCDLSKNGGIQKIVQAGRSTFYCPIIQK